MKMEECLWLSCGTFAVSDFARERERERERTKKFLLIEIKY